MKYIGVITSGALAGLGGAILVIEFAGIYREAQTGGRGFIGLAAMIIGNWKPIGTFAAALLFGFADALQLRNEASVHALLLFVAIALFIFAARAIAKQAGYMRTAGEQADTSWRHAVTAGILLVIGVGTLVWYLVSETVPNEFVFFTPHIVTLVVMGVASQHLRMPAADGQPYRKGEAT